MREIKFRGKRIDNGEWVYGYYAYLPDVNKIDEPNRDSMPDYKHYILNQYFDIIEVIPETVGQYIGGKGFKDVKNEHFTNDESTEVKLFEGDIVEAWSEGYKGTFIIKMRIEAQPTFMLYPNGQNGKLWSIAFSDTGRAKGDYYDSLRRIGNIHERSET